MTVIKSFNFPADSNTKSAKDRRKVVLELNNEKFELRDDLRGIELLESIASTSGPGSTRGIAMFYRRVVPAEDWERFSKAMEPVAPSKIGEICGELIDAYSAFPTTQDESSSSGS